MPTLSISVTEPLLEKINKMDWSKTDYHHKSDFVREMIRIGLEKLKIGDETKNESKRRIG
jgi:metal-responsive CopG/Arc/MetJ family transcriptional regulator